MSNTLIRKLDNFMRLSDADRVFLSSVTGRHIRHFAHREDIVAENEKPEAMLVVLSGWAARYKVLEDGRRQIMSFFLPGDLCDLNVFVLRRMDHAIGALTPATVAEIDRAAYGELLQAHPRITEALWWESLVTAAIQREWALNLGQRDASERVAHLFCEIFLRLQAVGQTMGNACELPLTQAELGEATGLSSVHVNRTLQDLRAAKLIVLRGKVLTIPDLPALQRAALFNPNYLHLEQDGTHLGAQE